MTTGETHSALAPKLFLGMNSSPVGQIIRRPEGLFEVRSITPDGTLKLRHGPDTPWSEQLSLLARPQPPKASGFAVPTAVNDWVRTAVASQIDAKADELASLQLEARPEAFDRVDPRNTVFANELACVAIYVRDLTKVVKHLRERGFPEARAFDIGSTQALVALTPDRKTLAIAFRGTMGVGEFGVNLDANFTRYDFEGSSHRGFERYVSAVEAPIHAFVSRLMRDNPDAKLLITGYSLGAAAAINYAGRAIDDGVVAPSRIGRVITAGAPRVLDREGIRALEAALPRRIERQVNAADWITMIPDPVVISSLANVVGIGRSLVSFAAGAGGALKDLLADNTGTYTHNRDVLWYDGKSPAPKHQVPRQIPSIRDHSRSAYLERSRAWAASV